jgi:hypothetical protein
MPVCPQPASTEPSPTYASQNPAVLTHGRTGCP